VAVERCQLFAQPAQIEVLVEPSGEMVTGNLVVQLEGVEQPVLRAAPSCSCSSARSHAFTKDDPTEFAIGLSAGFATAAATPAMGRQRKFRMKRTVGRGALRATL
jgi:hypothetical protein